MNSLSMQQLMLLISKLAILAPMTAKPSKRTIGSQDSMAGHSWCKGIIAHRTPHSSRTGFVGCLRDIVGHCLVCAVSAGGDLAEEGEHLLAEGSYV